MITNQAFIDELLSGQIDLLRYSAGVRAKVLGVLTRLQTDLTAKLQAGNLSEFGKLRTQQMLKQATDTINAYYATAQNMLNEAMANAAEVAAGHTTSALKTTLDVVLGTGLPSETFLGRVATNALVLGAPSSEWWSKQAKDTAFKFASTVRRGIAAGETNEQIVARIAGSPRKGIVGVMDVARSNARSLVHSSIQAAANASRMETYRKNSRDFRAVQWLGTLDSKTCPQCGARDLKQYTLDDPPQPIGHAMEWDGGPGVIHWSCRCIAVGVVKDIAGLKLPIGQRASSMGPVKGNVSFQQFLDRRGKAWQDENLGSGRADLYRRNKLTLEQLLSMDGTRINNVETLKARYS